MPSALAAFERFKAELLSNSPTLSEGLYAEDIVIERPFGPPGRPNRIEGLAQFRAQAEAGRKAMALRIDAFQDEVVHVVRDESTVVVEYRLLATRLDTGVSGSAPFVAVLGVDAEGRINIWREYQDAEAMKAALG
jgi:ketosteroid isomerase-like protein